MRPLVAHIDLDALRHNYQLACRCAPQSRSVAVIKADAGLTAQVTMGAADGEAAKIYADTFGKDKDFYAFWRRMEAYRQAFGAGGSTMILGPDSDFFRYLADPLGKTTAPAPAGN